MEGRGVAQRPPQGADRDRGGGERAFQGSGGVVPKDRTAGQNRSGLTTPLGQAGTIRGHVQRQAILTAEQLL